jgi:hypothetical protein
MPDRSRHDQPLDHCLRLEKSGPAARPAPAGQGQHFYSAQGELEACHVNRADGNLLFLKRKNLRHGNQPAT